uniref:rRNA-processing protein EBP2 n=1 Tax=Globodera rostochiensis TaxID=31243 RepID=A0A914GX15_GLORO
MSDSDSPENLDTLVFMEQDEEDGSNCADVDGKQLAENSSDDSDYDELQIAFKEGILQKHGLNAPQIKKRESIYKKDEMELKFVEFHKRRAWLDTLSVSFAPNLCYMGKVDDDFEREAAFTKQAMNAVQTALPRLHSLKVPIHRPSDYFAEMAKSDEQMDRVEKRLRRAKTANEKRDQSQRQREERKFAVKVQRSREERKRTEKRKLIEATKKHRKGIKGQLEEMLTNTKGARWEDEEEDGRRPDSYKRGRNGKRSSGGAKMSRKGRNKKFGFGGQKKRSKGNDRKSFEMH